MIQTSRHRCCMCLIPAVLAVPLILLVPGCGKEESPQDHDAHVHADSDSAATRPSSETSTKQDNDYPLTTCVVSGDPLDATGEAFVIQHEGREVRFCCRSCITQFKEDPAKYLALLDQAEKSHDKAEPSSIDHDEAGHNDHEGHQH